MRPENAKGETFLGAAGEGRNDEARREEKFDADGTPKMKAQKNVFIAPTNGK